MSNLSLDKLFPYPLDDFQLQAVDCLNQGHSVVVSAPTGSGKTLIGEYAIYRAIAHGQKVFYTTPLKALSNQKLRDFRKQFGYENVGLLTGDTSLNRDASIIVMTTEIFRNMLYAEVDGEDDPLLDVETVVLDECHYMNDSQRGTVWEESIIYCPTSVQFVALSATIANSIQLTNWIENVHGPTDLITSEMRPVPLKFNFCSQKGLHPLLNDEGTALHPNNKVWRPPKGKRNKQKSNRPLYPEPPSIGFIVSQLEERKMLPSIFFVFSRRGCDKAVKSLKSHILVSKKERNLLKLRLRDYSLQNPDGIRDSFHIDSLLRGIASHHAGILPAWKEFVERLFQDGLIKIIFATETLAAGINMPARSTVILTLSKRCEEGHRLLKGSEFLQMAGRAGRRGLDEIGYVVTVQSRFEGIKEACQLAISPPDPLISQFTPSYGMVLNLLQRYDEKKAKELIERSFGRYLADLDLVNEEKSLCNLENEISNLKINLEDIPWSDFDAYEKIRSRLREERRLLKILKKQASETLSNELTSALNFSSNGTLVTIKVPQLNEKPTPAVIVDKIETSGQFPYLLCITIENVWILLSCQSVVSLHAELSCLDVDSYKKPYLSKLGETCFGDDKTILLTKNIEKIAQKEDLYTPQYDLAGEVTSQYELVLSLEKELDAHPAHRWGDRKKLKKFRRRIDELEIELITRKNYLSHKVNHHWDSFKSLSKVLEYFGCFNNNKLSEIGRTVSSIRGDNELWIGLIVMSGHLDDLEPHELAGILQGISTDINRREVWCDFFPSSGSEDLMNKIFFIRKDLISIQERFSIDVPVLWNLDVVGLVEQWTIGISWNDLVRGTSLDEGDIVRLLRRTVDILSQIPHCEAVSDKLRNNARRALKLINRFPVLEDNDYESLISEDKVAVNPATERAD